MAAWKQGAALWLFMAQHCRGMIVPLSSLPPPWNPFEAFQDEHKAACAIVAVRIVGGATVLPTMEEVRDSCKLSISLHAATGSYGQNHPLETQ